MQPRLPPRYHIVHMSRERQRESSAKERTRFCENIKPAIVYRFLEKLWLIQKALGGGFRVLRQFIRFVSVHMGASQVEGMGVWFFCHVWSFWVAAPWAVPRFYC